MIEALSNQTTFHFNLAGTVFMVLIAIAVVITCVVVGKRRDED
jgi:hypothetical protein